MKNILIAIALVFGFSGAAHACPDYEIWGNETYNSSGQQLFTPRTFNVTAGGDNFIESCGFVETGYFTTTPDFSFDLSGMQGYRLEIRVVSTCDATLLVNTADTTWYYDDDSNGQADPMVNLSRVSDGVLDVWVGTYNGDYCDAQLTLETF